MIKEFIYIFFIFLFNSCSLLKFGEDENIVVNYINPRYDSSLREEYETAKLQLRSIKGKITIRAAELFEVEKRAKKDLRGRDYVNSKEKIEHQLTQWKDIKEEIAELIEDRTDLEIDLAELYLEVQLEVFKKFHSGRPKMYEQTEEFEELQLEAKIEEIKKKEKDALYKLNGRKKGFINLVHKHYLEFLE
jgi:hypothetical protein